MIPRTRCVVCGHGDATSYPAVVSPFIAERVGTEAVPCRLLECRGCGHRYFDLALDDAEMGRLYADYRGPSYLRARRAWEPWYTSRVNAGGSDPEAIHTRRRILSAYLRRSIPSATLAGSVLDFGGDRGQFVPPEIGTEKFVFDVSNQPTHAGVVRIVREEALQERRFDLVLLCHVIEHLSEPFAFVDRLPALLGPRSSGHWICVEVPLERFRILKRSLDAHGVAPRPPPRRGPAWLARDFYSTLIRAKLGVVPPGGVIKLHEHQSFFSQSSLRALFVRAGYEVVDAGVASTEGTGVFDEVLRLLARHPGPASAR